MWCNIIVHGRIVILVRRGPTRFRGPIRFPRLKGGAPLVATLSPTIILPAESSTAQLKLFRPLEWTYLDSLILLHGDAYPLRSLRLHHHPHHRLHPYQFRFHSYLYSPGTPKMGLIRSHSSLRNRGTPRTGLGHLVSPLLPWKALK
jgi:hypothetical protein